MAKDADGWESARLTGYHPRDVRNPKERKQEGRDNDSAGLPLHYLEEYDPAEPESFVGLAADNAVFARGDEILIKEYPEIRFVVRDNGGGFNGKTAEHAFDIPVLTRQKAAEVTGPIHWRRVLSFDPAPSIGLSQPVARANAPRMDNKSTALSGLFDVSSLLIFLALGWAILGRRS